MTLHLKPPPNFKPSFAVTSLFLQHDADILLLLRQDHKPQGDQWGVPAGKIEPSETPEQALLREVREETSLTQTAGDLRFVQTVFVRYAAYDFTYHIYQTALTGPRPTVVIDPQSHKDFIWVTPQAALALNLIEDLNECIEIVYLDKSRYICPAEPA